MTPEEILKCAAQEKADRANIEAVWADVERYIAPLSSNGFDAPKTSEGAVNWATKEVWDATAVIGNERLAAAFYAGTVNNYQRWFRNAFPVQRLNKEPAARAWLDGTSEALFNTLVASNFGLETASGFRDLTGYGTTGIRQELAHPTKWQGFQFSARPLKELLFEEDWRGRVRRWYEVLTWTPEQIISKFAPSGVRDETLVPKEIWDKAEAGRKERERVTFCIYPNIAAAPMSYGEKARAVALRPFHAKYIIDSCKKQVGETEGYYEMPSYVLRYLRTPGSKWGYGPGILALPTVKFLNVWLETYVNAAEKAVDPSILTTERGLMSDPDFTPGGITQVRSLDDVKPFESAGRFDVAAQVILTFQEMIRRHFREDDLQLKDSPAMTATESQIREARTNRVMAAPVGRVQNDYFDPMLSNSFAMMYRAGQIEDPPDMVLEELAKAKTSEIRVEYLGPLMRSQRADDVAALERLASGVAALQKMGFEEVSDVFNAQQTVREMAELLSVPGLVLRSDTEAQALREQRMQLQAAAAAAEIRKTQAEGARAAAGAQEMARGAA